ncbi:hypoxanthine phosphoribosyltransferase [Desulfallas thermosapovorans]|uniref:Hypoxanthine phosphoribosyltransferase n=1 Tax=Desulfallas thermosapovorans DSM 6562 TaxID=1121431 RepID=A0A5S4ZU48_9FIRM|nr:hypoxanthine phosphoribosyltransferase [Desulfallas thermosapovorans]TYO96279.1 hypoxanthine phosphoribosyltransferase [Desulfallas thermosapovorans DSM 6562]
MHPDVEKVLIPKMEIDKKVQELGNNISRDYAGKELLMVGILKGAVVFMADLIRAMNIDVRVDFMAVSSYGASSKSTGVVRILKDLDKSIENRHVLIVEDIVDTGLTLNYLLDVLKTRDPASVRICTLLDKPSRREVNVPVDYSGFSIPDEFVVGYGLDYNEKYRHLPEIFVLKKEIYQ